MGGHPLGDANAALAIRALPPDRLRERPDDLGRAYRGRGLATAIKVEALLRAKAKGLRAMLTTNDEPNKAMREINAKLGYQLLPAHVQLEKPLLH